MRSWGTCGGATTPLGFWAGGAAFLMLDEEAAAVVVTVKKFPKGSYASGLGLMFNTSVAEKFNELMGDVHQRSHANAFDSENSYRFWPLKP